MTTFDTNIFFYAVDTSAGERHAVARRVLAEIDPRHSVVLLQTLGELCFSVGRKRPELLPKTHVVVEKLMSTFDVFPASPQDLKEALGVQRQHGLPFWDAMLWAAAKRTDCDTLLTEDFQDGQELQGVTFRNPFTMRAAELKSVLA